MAIYYWTQQKDPQGFTKEWISDQIGIYFTFIFSKHQANLIMNFVSTGCMQSSYYKLYLGISSLQLNSKLMNNFIV